MYQKGLPVFDMFPAAVSKQKIEIKSLQNILRSISWTIKTYFSEKQDQITQSTRNMAHARSDLAFGQRSLI